MKSSISDFSEQWSDFTKQSGVYASEEELQDYFGPLLKLSDLKGKQVCEVGSGNGRFVRILSQHAEAVTAIEPCKGIKVSQQYNSDRPNVTHIQSDIYDVSRLGPFDMVFCLGVLHHTPDPVCTLQIIKTLLKDGGSAVIWVYGKEGNSLYLFLAHALRLITTHLPHRILKIFSFLLALPLKAYIFLCRFLPLPMRAYMRNVLGRYDFYTLKLTIYDQLNPSIAFYWSAEEFKTILEQGGFSNPQLYHRHGYSWTARVIKG